MKLRFIYRALKARFRDEKLEIRATLQAIEEGNLVLDIGANKGAYLYWLRKAVGPTGIVYAFEPQPSLHVYLKEIVQKMSWSNVFIKPVAVSDKSGNMILHIPAKQGSPSPGARLASKFETTTNAYQVECRVETLDNYSFDRPLSFIKCDVEGHELQVFRGGKNLLFKDGPTLLFECESRHLHGHSMYDVFNFLENLGYQGFFFGGDKILPLPDFDPNIHQQRTGVRYWDKRSYYNNFLFQRRT
jgi:FkbM family methyltransferase